MKEKENELHSVYSVEIGLNGVGSYLDINQQIKDAFNEDSSINESVIHFLETFRVKNPNPTPML
ncbi:MAG: hypothetical protein LUQ38_10990 [Methanotrichaceae archaeon]|nr:hypothetical protein [Methanotrichaceae archaeon]